MNITLDVPDHTTMSRRSARLAEARAVEFIRDDEGDVIAFEVTSSRCRKQRFDKVTAPK